MDYNSYANAVNKIFELINRMKVAWPTPTNKANVEQIEEYREMIIEKSKHIQEELNKRPTMEELGE